MYRRQQAKLLKEWDDFYSSVFDINFDKKRLKGFLLPRPRLDYKELMLIPEGLTLGEAFDVCTEYFPIYTQYNNLDEQVCNNDRDCQFAYAIRFNESQEPHDKAIRLLSPVKLRRNHCLSMTLLERLIYGLKFFIDTGSHLDLKNITVCAGSRDSCGEVPFIYTYNEKIVHIKTASPYETDSNVYARQVFL